MSEGEWVLIGAGCAECSDWPLVEPRGRFDSPRAAAESVGEADGGWWRPHPRGGFMMQTGSSGYWIAPLSALSFTDPLPIKSEFDAPEPVALPENAESRPTRA